MPYSNATKQAFADALRKLLEQKPFAKISVSHICEECGMNRKSFYYHFKDKYDLVNWILTLKLQRFFQKKNGKMPALHGIYWKKSVSIFINTGHSIRRYCRLRGRTLLQNISGIF